MMIVQIYKNVKTFMKNKGFYYFIKYNVLWRRYDRRWVSGGAKRVYRKA